MVEQSPAAGLPGPATYAWGTASDHIPGDNNPRVNNDIIADMVQHAINTSLAHRGYALASTGSAAWLVHYHAGLEKKSETVTETRWPEPAPRVVCGRYHCEQVYGWGYYGPPEYVTRTVVFHEGTLIVDIHDAASGKLAWRGTLSDEVNVNAALDPVKLQKAVDALLAHLPQGNAGTKTAVP